MTVRYEAATIVAASSRDGLIHDLLEVWPLLCRQVSNNLAHSPPGSMTDQARLRPSVTSELPASDRFVP